jgi:hypothetical protein
LLYRPVRKHRNELSRVQVGSNDIVGHLNDSKAAETGGDIGLMIIYAKTPSSVGTTLCPSRANSQSRIRPVRFDM